MQYFVMTILDGFDKHTAQLCAVKSLVRKISSQAHTEGLLRKNFDAELNDLAGAHDEEQARENEQSEQQLGPEAPATRRLIGGQWVDRPRVTADGQCAECPSVAAGGQFVDRPSITGLL
jgi:hypothetical protein